MTPLDRLRRNDDDGFTVVELLVTMVITGIVLAILGTFFANISRLTNWSGQDRDKTGQAALALDAVRSVVRVAADLPVSGTTTNPAVVKATPTTLTITAYSNASASITATPPIRVTFALVSDSTGTGILQQTRQVATMIGQYWSFANSGVGTTTEVARGFSTDAATPFFTYVDSNGKVFPMTNPVTGANLAKITFIRVTTTLDAGTTSGGPTDDVVVTTSIGMPNLQRDVSATVSVPNLPTPTTTPTPTPTPVKSSSSAPPSTPSGGSGTGSGTGSGSGSGSGTSSPGTGSGGTGTSGGGSGTSSPKPSTSSPKPTTTTTTTTPKPTPRPTVVDL